jgi:hypothetical protein
LTAKRGYLVIASSEQEENTSAGSSPGANRSLPETAEMRGFWRGIVSAFILFHLIAILCWALPLNFAPMEDVKTLTRPYMVWSGLFQSWDFFAPNPKSANAYIEAAVITQDRHQFLWAFPRMEQLGYFERYRKERYRKFAEVLPLQRNAMLWPVVAQRIGGFFKNPADPPQSVVLIQFSAPIQPGLEHGPLLVPKPRIFYEYEYNLAGNGQ